MPTASTSSVKIKTSHYQELKHASEVTGYSITHLLDEALSDYIECVLPTTVEAAERRRTERRMRVVSMKAVSD